MPHNNWDRYLDPPDEPEQEYCETCGQEMSEIHTGIGTYRHVEYKCTNPFCPNQFSEDGDYSGNVVKDMAEHLVEVEQELKSTKDSLKYVRNSLAYVEGIRQEREQTIETLEKVIEKLTQSQQGEE